jgi:hypothetical protein
VALERDVRGGRWRGRRGPGGGLIDGDQVLGGNRAIRLNRPGIFPKKRRWDERGSAAILFPPRFGAVVFLLVYHAIRRAL